MPRFCFLLLTLLLAVSPLHATADSPTQLVEKGIQASKQHDYLTSYQLLYRALRTPGIDTAYTLRIRILSNLAINQAEQGNFPLALNSLQQAAALATEHTSVNQALRIRANMASVYALSGQNSRALKEYLQVYALIAPQAPEEQRFRGGVALNIANHYLTLQADTLRALPYVRTATALLASSKEHAVPLIALQATYQLAAGRPHQALQLLEQPIKQQAPAALLQLKAQAFQALGQLDSTALTLRQLIATTPDLADQRDAYQLLGTTLTAMHRYPEALQAKDSLLRITQRMLTQQASMRLESQDMLNQVEAQQEALRVLAARHRLTLLLLLLIVISLSATIYALVLQVRLRRRSQEAAQLTEKRLHTELTQQHEAAQRYQEQATATMEQRAQQLMSKALLVAHKNDEVRQLLLQLINPKDNDVKISANLRRHITTTLRTLDTTDEWHDFTTYFEKVNAHFLQRLHALHPTLTAPDIRFLSLVSINLNTKEIALLLHITPEYCKKKRQQLARKLSLESTRQLYAYLSGLSAPNADDEPIASTPDNSPQDDEMD